MQLRPGETRRGTGSIISTRCPLVESERLYATTRSQTQAGAFAAHRAAPPSTVVRSQIIPKSTIKSLQEAAKNALCTYFLMVQPIRSKRDRAYIDQLAVDLAATYLHADTSKLNALLEHSSTNYIHRRWLVEG